MQHQILYKILQEKSFYDLITRLINLWLNKITTVIN